MIGQRYDIDGAAMVKHENGEWVRYDDYADALGALQEMCRMTCDFRDGFYDPMGSGTCHDALAVLVNSGRLEWSGEPGLNGFLIAKDKEAQG